MNNSSDIDFKDFKKLYTDYNQEPYSFLVNDTTSHPARRCQDDIVATSFRPSQLRWICVSNETPNDVSEERRQDVSVVRLYDVINEHRDNVSRVRDNNVPLARLHYLPN